MKIFESHIKSLFGTYNAKKSHVFVIVKPGFLDRTASIIRRFEEDGWRVGKMTTKKLLLSEAHKLYAIHKKEDWYEDLCRYMASDLSTAIIFTKNRPMHDRVFKQVNLIKDEVRKQWGESEMRNVMHSSDSEEHMSTEAAIYFNL